MSPVNGRRSNTLWPRMGGLEVLRLRGTTRSLALLKRASASYFLIRFYFVLRFKLRKLSKDATTGPKQPEGEAWGPEW